MSAFDSVRDSMSYQDAVGQAKAIADLLTAVGDGHIELLDETLYRAAQCLQQRLEVIDSQYEKLWQAYVEARRN